MKDAQKPDHVSLNTVVSRLKEGRYVIPDFQREFEWKPLDIADLMRSIFRDYYIGSLLLWKGKKENFEALACEHVYGYKGSDSNREHIVLDGQQRLTAMHYAFLAPEIPLPRRKKRYLYFIRVDRFINEDDEEAFIYDWTRHGPKLLANTESQYEQHLFPLIVVGQGGFELFKWFQGYQEYWSKRQADAKAENDKDSAQRAGQQVDNGKTFCELIKSITEQYQIAYIELDRDLELAKVCDIFTKINSTGIQLDIFDLMNAMLKPKGLQLKNLYRKSKSRLEFVETAKMNIYILQVMSILRQAYCSPKYLYYLIPGQPKQVRDSDGAQRQEILIPDVADFEVRWKSAVEALESAIKMLKHPHEYGVSSSQYLPYISILPAFAALQSYVSNLSPMKQQSAQRKIRHWYWASVFTKRYSGAVESKSTRDFLDVCEWISDEKEEPTLIGEFKQRFRNLDLRKENKRGTSIYNGIFNLLVLKGARDWATGKIPQYDDLDDHHIVPKSWGKKHLKGKAADTILNRTPLTSGTNRHVIHDSPPNKYLPEMIDANGEAEVRKMLDSHFISAKAQAILMRNPFTPDDFDAFIEERQKTILDAIQSMLIQSSLELPPKLRDLDQQIGQIELGLRNLINTALSGDEGLIPTNVSAKVDERLEHALKKNIFLDSDDHSELEMQLEYFDMRELQDTITNRSLWERFAKRFSSKEALITKFGQLAELRNGIRHSRSIDEVTRKEGEAAILWFQKALG